MLKLNLIRKPEDLPKSGIIYDVELELIKIKLQGTDLEKKMIQAVEKGQYLDPLSFIDRYGYKLHKSDLSTGCKAGLVVLNRPNTPVSLIECGYNAVSAIIQYCRDGEVYTYVPEIPYICFEKLDLPSVAIDVELDGKRFYTMSKLNDYIQDDREIFRRG